MSAYDPTELIELCQRITGDGDLTDKELYLLAEWLNEHPEACHEWPGNLLVEPLQQVWADGTIEPQELGRIAHTLIEIEAEWAKRQAPVLPEPEPAPSPPPLPPPLPLKRGRPATEKQLNFIRSFGVEPGMELTVAEASRLLDRLLADPEALERKAALEWKEREAELEREWQQEQRLRQIPAPKGTANEARRLIKACKATLPLLEELQSRRDLIVERRSALETLEDDAPEWGEEELSDRIDAIESALNVWEEVEDELENLSVGIEEWEDKREVKRLRTHGLAATVALCEKEVAEARADLTVLLEWSEDLLERLPTEPPPKPSHNEPERPVERKKPVRRMPLKTQLQSEPGKQLLNLVSSFSLDGKLEAEELQKLRVLLDAPVFWAHVGVKELKDQIDRALTDGVVERGEHYELVWAVRQILPKTARLEWDLKMTGPDRPATDAQLSYITNLGGSIPEGLTVREASRLIEALLEAQDQARDEFVWQSLRKL